MSNSFYDHTSAPAQGSSLSSAVIRAELDAIEQGFDKLPALAGNGNKKVVVNGGGTALTIEADNAANVDFTPAGSIASATVQAAIEELDSEKSAVGHTHAGYQAASANLDEYAAVNPTAAGLALLDDADASAQRTTLGLVIGTDVQAYDADIATVAASQAEMEAGSEAALRSMSPLRVSQAIAALAGGGGVQIQPVSATVGSNALTISASSLSLDFRSTTLGSGAVTAVSGTPSNLVISSGSTLGTINATQSRIVVLAINNAGTIELAAVNIAGGNDLSETGLISTTAEGGAGAADSSNVIYSTTARSNVAYRVIGYIESTQATAGTWATAPSTIQGAGGNALTAMSSLGYGQTWQAVTGSRAFGTTYYNTTGKPIFVSVSSNSTSSNGSTSLTVGGQSVAYFDHANTLNATVSGIVPVGASYSVAVNTATLDGWFELR